MSKRKTMHRRNEELAALLGDWHERVVQIAYGALLDKWPQINHTTTIRCVYRPTEVIFRPASCRAGYVPPYSFKPGRKTRWLRRLRLLPELVFYPELSPSIVEDVVKLEQLIAQDPAQGVYLLLRVGYCPARDTLLLRTAERRPIPPIYRSLDLYSGPQEPTEEQTTDEK